MVSSANMLNLKALLPTVFLSAILSATLFVGRAAAEEQPAISGLSGYVEFGYLDDKGIGWTGAETTFYARAKLDLRHQLHDDVLARVGGEWRPTVNSYARAYSQLKQREAAPEDSYIQIERVAGWPVTVRLGVVKVPYGIFDTMALDDHNRPISSVRTREWDYGGRADIASPYFDLSFAVVNGEGVAGTDSNSAKSIAARISFPASGAQEIYPETLEVTDYPNPLSANPTGEFRWQAGISGYNGNRYSTPIKQKSSHYGADLRLEYSIFSVITQYSFLEGGFTDPSVVNTPIATLDQWFQYSGDVTYNIQTYPRGYSVISEVAAGITEKTVFSVCGEYYDPDSESEATPQQRPKQRLIIGLKHDFRPRVTGAVFCTITYDPTFGVSGNILQSDPWKGEDILMAAMSVRF